MIDIRKLKELVRLMVENDLSELDLQDQQETVTIKRGGPPQQHIVHAAPMMQGMHPGYAAPAGAGAAAADAGEGSPAAAGAEDPGLVAITSPMVGTVYLAANPDTPAFASVGTNVGAETTVCLIEAMKVFNEIKAEVNGTIERVLVENGKAVEYGQKLFLVRPS